MNSAADTLMICRYYARRLRQRFDIDIFDAMLAMLPCRHYVVKRRITRYAHAVASMSCRHNAAMPLPAHADGDAFR